MKKLAIVILIVISLISYSSSAVAATDDGMVMVTDLLIVKPLSLAATVFGTAMFIVALPVTIPSSSVKSSARVHVADPFKFTFTKPLGQFQEIERYEKAEKVELEK